MRLNTFLMLEVCFVDNITYSSMLDSVGLLYYTFVMTDILVFFTIEFEFVKLNDHKSAHQPLGRFDVLRVSSSFTRVITTIDNYRSG